MNKILPIAFALLLSSCYSENSEDLFPPKETIPADKEISFSMDVKPILVANCATSTCHNGQNEPNVPGDWRVHSELIPRITSGVFKMKVLDPATRDMPRGVPESLAESDRDILRRWVEQGAKNN